MQVVIQDFTELKYEINLLRATASIFTAETLRARSFVRDALILVHTCR